MAHYLEKPLAEIKQQLGPLLKDLKLKSEVSRTRGAFVVQFGSKRSGGESSPVSIIFDAKHISGLAEASWAHAHLEIDLWARRELGETGWESWKRYETARHEIRGEGNKMFDWLEFVIEYNGIVPRQVGSPNCIANPNFGDLYETVADWVPDVEILQWYDDFHSSPLELFKFSDRYGRDVEIGMRLLATHAAVHIDGVHAEDLDQRDHIRFNAIVRGLSRSYNGPEKYPR